MAKAPRTKESGKPLSDPTSTPAAEAASGNDASDNGHAQDRIAARAYELYLARGGTHGQDWDDWLAAEREFARSEPEPRSDRPE